MTYKPTPTDLKMARWLQLCSLINSRQLTYRLGLEVWEASVAQDKWPAKVMDEKGLWRLIDDPTQKHYQRQDLDV